MTFVLLFLTSFILYDRLKLDYKFSLPHLPQWGSSFKELKSGENVLVSGKILSMATLF